MAENRVGFPTQAPNPSGEVIVATNRVETPSIGTNSGNQHPLPSGTGTVLTNDPTTITAQITFPSTTSAPVVPRIYQAPAGNAITVPAPSSPDTLTLLSQSQTLTNKTISGSSNTISNVSLTSGVTGVLPRANGGLGADVSGIGTGLLAQTAANTWAVRTLTATGSNISVTNGDGVSGNPTVALSASVVIDSGVQTLTNKSIDASQLTGSVLDARLSANVVLLSGSQTFTARKTFPSAGSNAAIIPAILGGGTGTNGHTVPNVADDTFTLNAASQTLTNKTITAPVLSGSATGTYTLAGTLTITSPAISGPTLSGSVAGTYTIAGTPTLGSDLAAGSHKITGLAAATASGDALSYPDIGSSNGSASLSASSHTITSGSGTYEDIGLSVPLPSAGTYIVSAELFATINATSGLGYIVAKMVNSTDSSDISNSERRVVAQSTTSVAMSATMAFQELITVAGAKTIKIQAFQAGGASYAGGDKSFYHDTNGRCRMRYVKVSPT